MPAKGSDEFYLVLIPRNQPLVLVKCLNMKTRNILFVWASVLGVPILTYSQTSLHGKISDDTGQPVTGARVAVTDSYQGTVSSVDGTYHLHNLKPGTCILEITSPGFTTLRDTFDISGTEMTKNYTLNALSYMSEEIVVSALRAGNGTPTTYTNISTKQIEKINYGQDMPYLFNLTPSTVVTSDAGAGVGYTGIRIRGVDPTRTNVTINGIPVNDSESHGTYWVDMPDFASSVDNIQIQRGVGTSSNGAAAFGASINIKTNEVRKEAYGEILSSYGSFNTYKNTVKVGSGLINDKFTLDARLSSILSDGYIDRASSDLKSFYLSGAWLGKKSVLRANIFTGKEITYQAWWGTPQAVLFGNADSLTNHYYNNLGYIYQTQADSMNLFNSGRTYNYYTYKNEEDNYRQDHYQLHFLHSFNPRLSFNLAAHYTRGYGYYEQYRYQDSFATYGLDPVVIGSDSVTSGNFIRRRWLDNHFYGGIFSLNYTGENGLKITWGGSGNQYLGKHYGEIIWAEYASNSKINDHYYDNEATKTDLSSYVKATYQWKKITFYGDVQYRQIDYSFVGPDQVNGEIVDTEQDVTYSFVNPKAGLMYDLNDRNNFYASFAIGNREPTRDDFVNSTSLSRPKHETLQNVEAGYHYRASKCIIGINYFLMSYQNQLILTGAINDVGAYARTNVDKSYRTGIELEAGYRILKSLSISGNLTLSQNKIPEFTEYYDDYDNGGQVAIVHQNTDIAFSPNVISSGAIEYTPVKGLTLTYVAKYVGRQYLDNTSNKYRSMNPYFVSNVQLDYSWKGKFFKELIVGVQLNNIFNELYENNGYTYSYLYGAQTYTENFYYPQAGFNWMTRLAIKL